MTGAPVPPARPQLPPDSLLDGIGLIEAIARDDVEGCAAVLGNCDLPATARALDNLMAYELLHYSPVGEAILVLRDLAAELQHDSSAGAAVISLARKLCLRWCDSCIASGDLREWALGVTGHGPPPPGPRYE